MWMIFSQTNHGIATHILSSIRSGYDGPVVVAQDFAVGRRDPHPKASALGVNRWLEETVIGIPMIDEFKEQLRTQGMR